MTMKHTPGPWMLTDTNCVYALDQTGRCNRFYASVQGGFIYRGGPFADVRTADDELKANARLIAAAPDLLAALQGLVGEAMPGECFSKRIAAATAAIAKATA